MIKVKNRQICSILGVNNLYGWAMWQNLLVNNSKILLKDTSEIKKDFIKDYNEKSD